jgi:hypothetical protein
MCPLVGGCVRSSGGATAVTGTTAASTTTTTPSATTGPKLRGGYLARWTNGGIFLQITMTTATAFEGSVTLHLEYDDGLVDERSHFTGVVNKSDLTFRFDHSTDWRWGSSWSGSLS